MEQLFVDDNGSKVGGFVENDEIYMKYIFGLSTFRDFFKIFIGTWFD